MVLLRVYVGEYLFFGVIKRFMMYKDILFLGNNYVIYCNSCEVEISCVVNCVLDELVRLF